MSWEAGEKSHNSGKYVYEDGVRPLTDAAMRWWWWGGVGGVGGGGGVESGGNRDKGNFRGAENGGRR